MLCWGLVFDLFIYLFFFDVMFCGVSLFFRCYVFEGSNNIYFLYGGNGVDG